MLRPGEGESLFGGRIVLKSSFDQLTITESHFPDARDGADPHFHRRHVDSFYVLEGEVEFLQDGKWQRVAPGTFLSVPPNVEHGFRPAGTAIRLLNFHTPNVGFIGRLRED